MKNFDFRDLFSMTVTFLIKFSGISMGVLQLIMLFRQFNLFFISWKLPQHLFLH